MESFLSQFSVTTSIVATAWLDSPRYSLSTASIIATGSTCATADAGTTSNASKTRSTAETRRIVTSVCDPHTLRYTRLHRLFVINYSSGLRRTPLRQAPAHPESRTSRDDRRHIDTLFAFIRLNASSPKDGDAAGTRGTGYGSVLPPLAALDHCSVAAAICDRSYSGGSPPCRSTSRVRLLTLARCRPSVWTS